MGSMKHEWAAAGRGAKRLDCAELAPAVVRREPSESAYKRLLTRIICDSSGLTAGRELQRYGAGSNPVRGGLFIAAAPPTPPSFFLFFSGAAGGEFNRRSTPAPLKNKKKEVWPPGSSIDRPPLRGFLALGAENPCKEQELAPAFARRNPSESASKLHALHTLRDLPRTWTGPPRLTGLEIRVAGLGSSTATRLCNQAQDWTEGTTLGADCAGAPNPNGVVAADHRRLVLWLPGRNPVGVDGHRRAITQGWRGANPGLCSTTPLGLEFTGDGLLGCLGRQRRQSYQPRATPWVCRPKTILSAESAIHRAMMQAVGLPENKTAREPRALPWAGMNQAFGLRSTIAAGSAFSICAHTQGSPSHCAGDPLFKSLSPFERIA